MFEDPAFPSMPPPPQEEVKPMSLFGAGLWAFGAQIATLWVSLLFGGGGGSGDEQWDPVLRVMAQAAAFLLVIYGIVRVYAPQASMKRVLAFQKSRRWWFYPLAMVAGVGAIFPVDLAYEKLLEWVPVGASNFDAVEVFFSRSMPERVAIVVCFALIGPLVEELLFRGALITHTLEKYDPTTVIVATGTIFALVHVNLHGFLPYCLLGATLGYLRWSSGSMIPPLLFHIFYNGVPLVQLLVLTEKPTETESVDLRFAAGGLAVWILSVLIIYVADRTRRVQRASLAPPPPSSSSKDQ